MKSVSSRFTPVARALEPPPAVSLPAAFGEQLSQLYQLVQGSRHVFGSPLGPFSAEGRQLHLPRFVYFGPNAAEAALRLSFLGGFDHRDLRSTLALLRLVEGLALKPDLGQGLNLSFFPLLDVLGLAQLAPPRALATQDWSKPEAPEIRLLEKEARLRAYHGFVRLETAHGEDVVTVRLRAAQPAENFAPALELISSDDTEPLAVRWESEDDAFIKEGPLGIADDLPVQPFELIVRIPAAWSMDLYAEAAASILKRFVLRYRGFISYAQHL
ncbi:MAG TPA: hypothetical protein VEQ65_13400 [Opitutus sp.]|nr:hypothetical protein [Opitutus sp.]